MKLFAVSLSRHVLGRPRQTLFRVAVFVESGKLGFMVHGTAVPPFRKGFGLK
jgi:hypothetical protein